jgi:hypothetical protein
MKYFILLMLVLSASAIAQEPQTWDWNRPGGGYTNKPLYKKETKPAPLVPVEKFEASSLPMNNPIVKKANDRKNSQPQVYIRDPIIGPDGVFRSTRFLDINKNAAELYKVSGAAINAYSVRSMLERNALEGRLDAERAAWEMRKYYYLHNTTPWLKSKTR